MGGYYVKHERGFPMKIALLGHGTVGRGVDEIISSRIDGIEVARILELPQFITDERMTSDFDDIVGDPEIECVVECMGGVEPAHTFIAAALSAGKSVVTSNKAVVAEHFDEFVTLANENGVSFKIEASVGGGIPWIASIEKARRIDEIKSFSGIMNGTTNYVIESMRLDNLSFEDALKRAQDLGYAERDPSADIDGFDVRNKTLITASVAFSVACTQDVPVVGIRQVTKADLDFFAERDMTIKLLGKGVCDGSRYAVCVMPHVINVDSLEAAAPSNFNLCTIDAETVGTLKFYGQGAGSLPTGNAIVQDVIDVSEGRTSAYDFSRPVELDETLLKGDYVVRSRVVPESSEPFMGHDGYHLVRGLVPSEAVALIEDMRKVDEAALIAAL